MRRPGGRRGFGAVQYYAGRAPSSLGLMTTAEDDPDRQHESQAEAPVPAAEAPTPLRKAAAGMAEAQAWKGQQIAKGWRKLVNALRTREEGEGGRG
jgi:hypothetical protein